MSQNDPNDSGKGEDNYYAMYDSMTMISLNKMCNKSW